MSGIVFPPSPQTVHCEKCDRDVVVAVNVGRPGIESDCENGDCPISSDPDNQPEGHNGTLICFPDE